MARNETKIINASECCAIIIVSYIDGGQERNALGKGAVWVGKPRVEITGNMIQIIGHHFLNRIILAAGILLS